MKTLFAILIAVSSQIAFASVHGVQRSDYNCSNGLTYDLATYLMSSGGANGRSLRFVALCSTGTLKRDFYGWQLPSGVPEAIACGNEDTPQIRACMEEFLRLNPITDRGYFRSGNVQDLIQGR